MSGKIESRSDVCMDLHNGFVKVLNEVNENLAENDKDVIQLQEIALSYCSVTREYVDNCNKQEQGVETGG